MLLEKVAYLARNGTITKSWTTKSTNQGTKIRHATNLACMQEEQESQRTTPVAIIISRTTWLTLTVISKQRGHFQP
jgi:hypothetical protein